ncbi:pyrimidine 5'-nucleotidase [Reyranella sp. CPCC 100927]|uniref:pyrimidine 5'-nucleotidase n=1 Tax=Reyranella sp. CPCC 100927 TaxID=2599616 RepID=UPI0011B5A7C5|nr:pyrimidine 5'-nucleotidase [Reyranella sp. CPCC 100927]TWT03155.1 pyrimidine 5'-nucleotidase [Reyranella sp. CPCC 100927]
MTTEPQRQPAVWLFDLDNTLYHSRCDLFAQTDRRMGDYISRLLEVHYDEAKLIQKGYWRKYGTSLRGLMMEHKVEPTAFLDYVHDIDYSPVEVSPRLDTVLGRLPGRKIVFTNGTVRHATSVLERLGVTHHFEDIYDIVAANYVPKPEMSVYRDVVGRYGLEPTRAVMLDDMTVNLKPAHELGMRTVWIRTPESMRRVEGQTLDHIHHQTDDLLEWLHEWLDGPVTPSSRA